ncbi:transglycosylase domain-containing protein [Glutamicibacter endophyticus]|uniref:transglycosylase domain-containing protein n=1 Tax=Glutamicibacter endophyticus TaxID=1522174 RepID=UPI003AF10EFC
MAAKKSPFFDTATTMGKVVAFFGISALCGVLAAGMLVPVAAIAKTGLTTGSNIFSALPSDFEKLPISQPSEVLDRKGRVIASFYDQNREPVKLKDISPYMRKAIVSVEDERFYEHSGIDPRGIARALVSNLMSSSRQGASTLTQQYVNNLLINNDEMRGEEADTVSGDKSYAAKIRELKYAVAIEKEMSKDEILEGYLNLVLFSGREYGVQAAAQRFFSVDAKDLNLQQSAMLAGMVQLPTVYNPLTNPERALDRRNKVLANMYRTGAIDKKEYEKAVKSDLGTKPSVSRSGCMAAKENAYFCDYVSALILQDKEYGKTLADRRNLLYRGGLQIKTTLDAKLNKKAHKDAKKAIDPTAKSNDDVYASIVSVEPGTGNILAMAQNTNYDPDAKRGNTTYNLNVEASKGGAGGFQGGSTMKPYTTLAWLKEGHSMYDKINAKKQTFMPGYKFKASCLPGGTATVGSKWTPKNASYGFYKTMPVNTGLFWSINSATVQEATKLDLCNIAGYTEAVGLRDEKGKKNEDGTYTPTPISPTNPSFIIGSASITPLRQSAAFAAFANKGEYCEPRALTSVKDSKGNSYKIKKETCSQAVEEQYVADLNGTLQKIAKQRVSKGRVPGTIAGKTGTNNGATSTWFVGYTTGISTAAWVGRLKGQNETEENAMHGTMINDKRAPRMVDSSTYAAPLWVDFMEEAVGQFEQKSFGSARSAPKPKPAPKTDEDDDKSSSSDSKKESSDDKKESSKSDNKSEKKSSTSETKSEKKKSASAGNNGNQDSSGTNGWQANHNNSGGAQGSQRESDG